MHTFSIKSNYTNYQYDIHVYVPEETAPEAGFPVIYVLDGSGYFHYLADSVCLQSRNAPKTGVKAAIVVGICHDESEMRTRRFYDFTAPAAEYKYPKRMNARIPEQVGGGADFQQFIEEELKPKIEADYLVNRDEQTLFGHSLGGYFVLWNMLNADSYQNYIAISPSVWWNDHELIKMPFKREGRTIFIAVGEKEGHMVGDAELFAEKIGAAELYVAPEENHASVVPTVVSRALRFVSN
ncbi:alpha/beta hydrolase [Peribacillus faecalis]|nr:alpha/beta hydrolase-fold protein [Peribacillus faecalis]